MGMIKTKEEIRLIRKACSISNSCIPVIRESLKGDITERELAQKLRRHINKRGGTLSFHTLVGTGDRSRMIHTEPHVTDRPISGLGYIDFGARYKRYTSDITVPFVKGNINKEQQKAVDVVMDAYELAVKSVKVGKPCWEVYEKVDNFLKKYGFRMKHGLGHGIGLKAHERPLITKPRKESDRKQKLKQEKIKKLTFQPNMIFTIEPAVYTRKFGVRIENDFLLKKNKLVKLTDAKLLAV